MSDFVHLHNHSEFSLLDGLQKMKNMVHYAKNIGMNALAITDHGYMNGVNKFFGPGNFNLKLHGIFYFPPQKIVNEKLLLLSKKLGIPVVATNDNHYTRKEDAQGQEILLCIQTQTIITDKDRKLSMISSPD